jgi:hypothetical protein
MRRDTERKSSELADKEGLTKRSSGEPAVLSAVSKKGKEMGKYDSSITRVVPVFDMLKEGKDSEGWLQKLISLPTGGSPVALPPGCRFSIDECCWGNNEKKLDPPVALLSWLIRHPRPVSAKLSVNDDKAKKRQELLTGRQELVLEALSLLRHNPTREDWHIFEGQSQPDVYIQTPDLIVIIEGKRTEKKPTTSTKWMTGRHQMLRHIDCAWEIAGSRKVIGFFVVEGNSGSCDVPPEWIQFSQQTVTPEAIASSLPHRGPEEQLEIAKCYAGITTWQRVCSEFCISYDALPDEVAEKC